MRQEEIDALTLEDFAESGGRSEKEIKTFHELRKKVIEAGLYAMEPIRMNPPVTTIEIERQSGEKFTLLNFSTYNYLGYATHPQVIQSAKDALDEYGLGCTAAPSAGGFLNIHRLFEQKLIDFFGLQGRNVTLFNSGFAALVGTITAYIHREDCVIADKNSHASILDGMALSQGEMFFFKHNNMEHLEAILKDIDDGKRRILICTEGCFSVDGDYGKVREITKLARKYGATTLVDEAHSFLVAGPNGKGVCEEQGVLEDVDFILGTMSKTFAGIGGFLFAKEEISNYVNFFARNRMFSCALDPAVTGGMLAVLQLATGDDGKKRRERLIKNTEYLRNILGQSVNLVAGGDTWVVPVLFGRDNVTRPLEDFLQRNGLAAPLMVYPAVRKNKGRIRLFVTSEHTKEQLEQARDIIVKAGEEFGFLKS